MPEQNEKNLPKAPAFNPKVKETIAAFKENNNPKNLNDILNELVRSRCWPPPCLTCRASPPPSRSRWPRAAAQGDQDQPGNGHQPRGQALLPGFSDWDAVHEWQKAQPKAAQQIILLRFDDYANMIAKNAEASGLVINPATIVCAWNAR